MSDVVYTAHAILHEPTRFFAAAAADLRLAPSVAWRLFVTNVRVRSRRTWLGYLWLLLPAIATTAVWVYVRAQRIIDI